MQDVDFDENSYGGVSYDAMIETMELDEVLVEKSDDDYQGNTFMLVRKGEQYGHLTYGWGSCSGCDAAQAVDSQQEANRLRDSIYNDIRWFDSPHALHDWVSSGDHELQWYGHNEAFKQYLVEVGQVRLPPTEEELAETRRSIETAVQYE